MRAKPAKVATAERWQLSDGEIHFLWWFIQGSIMELDIRRRLRRAWGFCGRHAWGALAVEAAYRHGYLHGPAVLYMDLMGRALRAFELRGPGQVRRLARRLRATGPCHLCDLNPGRLAGAHVRAERIAEGRDPRALRAFAEQTRRYWWGAVCGRCLGRRSPRRCRPHLVEEASGGDVLDLGAQRAQVQDIVEHLRVYHQSFVWGYHHTETEEDRAALISAVGWCSGWRAWIPFVS